MSLIDLASLVLAPTAVKDGTVYNAIPNDQDFTFSRGTEATRVNSAGLIEKARTNFILNSTDLSQNTWIDNQTSTTANATTAPDGSNNAIKLVPNATNTFHYLNQTSFISVTSGSVVCFSIYVKRAGYDYVLFNTSVGSSSGNAGPVIDLVNGVVDSHYTATYDVKVEDAGNDWWRVSFFYVTNSTGTKIDFNVLPTSSVSAYSGDQTSGIFLWGCQLEQGLVSTDVITTTTSSVTVGITDDLPRVDYSGGGCPSLLLEGGRTNLVTNSEYVNSSDYVTGNWSGTITTNTSETLSPEGLYNATKFVKSGSTDRVYFQTSVSDGTYTGSMYFKAVSGQEGNTIEISVRRFGSGSGSTTKLITLSSEWQRVDVTATLSGGTNTAIYIADFSSSGNANSFYFYGLQLEQNASYVSSYIPTYGTSTSRSADSCSLTNASNLIGQSEGTLFVDVKVTLDGRLLLIGAAGNFLETLINSSGKVNAFVRTSVTEADILSTATYSTGDTLKVAFAYKQNDFALYVNGTAQGTDTNGNVPTNMAQIIINDYLAAGYNSANGYNQAILFPTRLTNDQLAELTK